MATLLPALEFAVSGVTRTQRRHAVASRHYRSGTRSDPQCAIASRHCRSTRCDPHEFTSRCGQIGVANNLQGVAWRQFLIRDIDLDPSDQALLSGVVRTAGSICHERGGGSSRPARVLTTCVRAP
eukprot:4685058-Prymnesium_polylepis.1